MEEGLAQRVVRRRQRVLSRIPAPTPKIPASKEKETVHRDQLADRFFDDFSGRPMALLLLKTHVRAVGVVDWSCQNQRVIEIAQNFYLELRSRRCEFGCNVPHRNRLADMVRIAA